MKPLNKILGPEGNAKVEARIKSFEENTGCELVVAIARESDPYPAAPLRFSFITTIIISLVATYYLSFHFDSILVLAQVVLILIFIRVGNINWVKKRVLVDAEVEREVNEKAVETFHELCTTKTQHQVSTLLYFSLLEKQIRLLVDKDLNEKIEQTTLDKIVNNLSFEIKSKKFADGIIHSIDSIEVMVLEAFGQKLDQVPPNEIKNQIFWL